MERLLPFLSALSPGQYVELTRMSGVLIDVEGWSCSLDGETPGLAVLSFTAGQMGTVHRLTFPDDASLRIRIPVLADGWLFGAPDKLNLTTKDGDAGPNVWVTRAEGDAVDLRKSYSVV